MTQASDVYSQKSSHTAAIYRWNILNRARISVDIGPLPEEVQGQFDPVFKREVPENRKLVLHQIAKDFVDDFTDALNSARRENDCMRPFEKALAAIDHDKKFYFPTFAGTVYDSHIPFTCRYAHLVCILGIMHQTSYWAGLLGHEILV